MVLKKLTNFFFDFSDFPRAMVFGCRDERQGCRDREIERKYLNRGTYPRLHGSAQISSSKRKY